MYLIDDHGYDGNCRDPTVGPTPFSYIVWQKGLHSFGTKYITNILVKVKLNTHLYTQQG